MENESWGLGLNSSIQHSVERSWNRNRKTLITLLNLKMQRHLSKKRHLFKSPFKMIKTNLLRTNNLEWHNDITMWCHVFHGFDVVKNYTLYDVLKKKKKGDSVENQVLKMQTMYPSVFNPDNNGPKHSTAFRLGTSGVGGGGGTSTIWKTT